MCCSYPFFFLFNQTEIGLDIRAQNCSVIEYGNTGMGVLTCFLPASLFPTEFSDVVSNSLRVSSESVALRLRDCWTPFSCYWDHSPNKWTLAALGLSARDPYSTILNFLIVVTEPFLLLQRDLIISNSNERHGLAWWSRFISFSLWAAFFMLLPLMSAFVILSLLFPVDFPVRVIKFVVIFSM